MKRIKKVFIVFGLILTAFLLSGCIKKGSKTLFVRKAASEYSLVFQEEDSKDFVTTDILLDSEIKGVKVIWESSNPDVVSNSGEVTLPDETTEVTLTARFEVDGTIERQKYKITVASKEDINLKEYNQALTAVQFLEVKNNEETYKNAAARMEKISDSNPYYNEVNERFIVQEKLYFAKVETDNFKDFPSQENFNIAQEAINKLDDSLSEKETYQSTINTYSEYIDAVELSLVALDTKQKADLDNALAALEDIPALLFKTRLIEKLSVVELYYGNIELLEANNLTQAELEEVILSINDFDLLTEAQIDNFEEQATINQKRIFDAEENKGSNRAYVEEKLREYYQSPNKGRERLIEILLNVYESANTIVEENGVTMEEIDMFKDISLKDESELPELVQQKITVIVPELETDVEEPEIMLIGDFALEGVSWDPDKAIKMSLLSEKERKYTATVSILDDKDHRFTVFIKDGEVADWFDRQAADIIDSKEEAITYTISKEEIGNDVTWEIPMWKQESCLGIDPNVNDSQYVFQEVQVNSSKALEENEIFKVMGSYNNWNYESAVQLHKKRQKRTVKFVVTVPEGYDKVYIVGNFTDWNPINLSGLMTPVFGKENEFELEIKNKYMIPQELEYTYIYGQALDFVELDQEGNEVPHRKVKIDAEQTNYVIRDTVQKFKEVSPEVARASEDASKLGYNFEAGTSEDDKIFLGKVPLEKDQHYQLVITQVSTSGMVDIYGNAEYTEDRKNLVIHEILNPGSELLLVNLHTFGPHTRETLPKPSSGMGIQEIIVTVPANTPIDATIKVIGSFNDWDEASAVKMDRVEVLGKPLQYRAFLPELALNTELEYKVYLESNEEGATWQTHVGGTVDLDGNYVELPNFGLAANDREEKIARFYVNKHKDEKVNLNDLEKLGSVVDNLTRPTLKNEVEMLMADGEILASLNSQIENLNNILKAGIEEFNYTTYKAAVESLNEQVSLIQKPRRKDKYEGLMKNHNIVVNTYSLAYMLETIELDEPDYKESIVAESVVLAKRGKNNMMAFAPELARDVNIIIEQNILVILDKLEQRLEETNTREDASTYRKILLASESGDYQSFRNQKYIDSVTTRQEAARARITRTKIILIFLAIVLFLIYHASVYDYAIKKGYEGIQWGLLALVPIVGLVYFIKAEKRRNTSKAGFKALYKPGELFAKFLIFAELVIISVIVLIPVIYIFGMAFSNQQSEIPNTIWPKRPNAEAFTYLFSETKFGTWWLNTFLIAIINMAVGTVVITGAAYVFARFSFKGKKAGLLTILVLQSFPTFMGLVAMFVLFWKFGLLGRPLALTILYVGGGIPGNVWLIKGFLDQIPKDLDESAMIDGANKLQIFVKIIMPLSIPILTFVAVNLFMAPWMDYMLPSYLLNVPPTGAAIDYDVSQQWTLAVGLFDLINGNEIHYAAFAAGALIVGGPITLLYMFFQKYLIEGVMAGATKG